MTNEASAAVDVRGLVGRFAAALEAAGFDFERPSLDVALRGYEEWLRKPVRGLTWGQSDCAIVVMEPAFDGTYEIDLRRHVGELDGREPSIGLVLKFARDRSRGVCNHRGTSVDAFDEPPAVWIACSLRQEPAVATALTEDQPVAAELRINGFPVTVE